MKYNVLKQIYYYQRELFVLEIENKYLLVYRGSGLNGGKVGRILPFNQLKTTKPRCFGDNCLGYIYKELFFNSKYISHHKDMTRFSNKIQDFIKYLEQTLPQIKPDLSFDADITQKFVQDTQIKITEAIGNKEPFDWDSLNN